MQGEGRGRKEGMGEGLHREKNPTTTTHSPTYKQKSHHCAISGYWRQREDPSSCQKEKMRFQVAQSQHCKLNNDRILSEFQTKMIFNLEFITKPHYYLKGKEKNKYF